MITINELFSGIGAQVAAFKRLNIPYKVIGISEIDKYAIQSYEAINGSVRNYGDRTAGIPTEQRLEINNTGCSNTLTSVQKDNYVVEPVAYDEQNGYIRKDGCVGTLKTDGSSPKHNNRVIEPQIIQLGNIVNTGNWDNPQRERIYSPSGISPALNTVGGGGLEPKIVTIENYMPSNHSAAKIVSHDGIAPTVMENHGTVTATVQNFRIRKLTPRECWRLMAFTDVEFDCAKLSGVSDSRLYQQAGNSIVVDVLVGIFRQLFKGDENE